MCASPSNLLQMYAASIVEVSSISFASTAFWYVSYFVAPPGKSLQSARHDEICEEKVMSCVHNTRNTYSIKEGRVFVGSAQPNRLLEQSRNYELDFTPSCTFPSRVIRLLDALFELLLVHGGHHVQPDCHENGLEKRRVILEILNFANRSQSVIAFQKHSLQ